MNKILNLVLKDFKVLSFYGRNLYQQISVYNDVNLLNDEFNRIELIANIMQNHQNHHAIISIQTILSGLKNLVPIYNSIKNQQVLDIVSLYEIKNQAIQITELSLIVNPLVNEKSLKILLEDDIISLLSDDHITYDFYLYDKYSNSLKDIRIEKAKIELLIKKSTKEEINSLLRKREEIVKLEEKYSLEVCKDLTLELKQYLNVFEENIKVIGMLDLCLAKARFSIKHQAIRPVFSQGEMIIKQMFDPILKAMLEQNHQTYTLNDIVIKKGVCLITGANMSGKSTILKNILINTTLAIHGFYVFAKSMTLPLFDYVILIDGDKNKHGISSFAQEIMEINQSLEKVETEFGLLLIDEFAKSTNPFEGERFVRALIQTLNQANVYSVVSTHYDVEIDSINHYQIKGLKDINIEGHIDIQDINKYIDYQLVKVEAPSLVPKEAYNIAKLLNVNKKFLKVLETIYRGDKNEHE